ncbi:MAG: phage tail sheath subtilisin-like domain-containing protein [Candidatus Bathyarchaeota archaeon]|nr:phage tail sheath subtilisin-like domain-containing protein [Candidatus Termiticorpusculum sp.]
MSKAYTYPGVYVEELPSSVRSIIGVGTSITAFVGRAIKGPTNKATLIHSFADYTRIFGGLWNKSNMSYAVYQYFQNGGMDAIIVRVINKAKNATFTLGLPESKTVGTETTEIIKPLPTAAAPFVLEVADPGVWGTKLDIVLSDADEEKKKDDGDDTYFNITVHQLIDQNERGPILEMFRNVSLKTESPRYIAKLLVEGVSTYLRIKSGIIPTTTFTFNDEEQKNPRFTLNTTPVAIAASDGDELDATVMPGKEADKTGIYALMDADLFNLLCIPAYSSGSRSEVYNAALEFCNKRRAILIVDPPAGTPWKEPKDVLKGMEDGYVDKDKNGAIFYPRIVAPDPLEDFRLKEFDPCGAVAGVIARTDAQRGVWKAPAGIEATLSGVPDLSVRLTNEQNGVLNPKGINCLRIMPDAGRVIWGSRTLRGADGLADQWKYLSVRRTALYIEETLFRGTQWVVFEPNDERLWSQIRLNIGAFMHSLFVKGAFQGTDPNKAYLVKCDSETTTQTDIDAGIVNIIVGFAPLKPAEFVVLKIQQLAGQELE